MVKNRIGIDVGGTNVKLALVDDKGQIKYSNSVPTRAEMGYEYTVENIKQAIHELLKETKIQNNSISNLITSMPQQFKAALNSGIASNLVPYLENLIFGLNEVNKSMKEVVKNSGRGDDVDDLF